MNSFIKYICVFCGGIGLLTSTTACTNLDEETFSEITESTYKYEAGDATGSTLVCEPRGFRRL